MGKLHAIDGGKERRAKTLAEATVLQCPCGSRRMREERVGVLVRKDGKVAHKGALVRVCGQCGRVME